MRGAQTNILMFHLSAEAPHAASFVERAGERAAQLTVEIVDD
jgi:hypothetical protein